MDFLPQNFKNFCDFRQYLRLFFILFGNILLKKHHLALKECASDFLKDFIKLVLILTAAKLFSREVN